MPRSATAIVPRPLAGATGAHARPRNFVGPLSGAPLVTGTASGAWMAVNVWPFAGPPLNVACTR